MSDFFRSDLNLESRWWHRFLKLAFFFFIAFCFVILVQSSYSILYSWHYKAAALDDRIPTGVARVKDLVLPGEIFDDSNFPMPSDYAEELSEKVYCSDELQKYENISLIQNLTDSKHLFVRKSFDLEDLSIKEFSEYLAANRIKCIIADKFFNNDIYGEDYFLEPDSKYQQKYGFYNQSYRKTAEAFFKGEFNSDNIDFLILLSFLTASILLLMILYYKVFIYIIFGPSVS